MPTQYLGHGAGVPVDVLKGRCPHYRLAERRMHTLAPSIRAVLCKNPRPNSPRFQLCGDLRNLLHRASPTETGLHSPPSPAIEKDNDEHGDNATCDAYRKRQVRYRCYCSPCSGRQQAHPEKCRPSHEIELGCP